MTVILEHPVHTALYCIALHCTVLPCTVTVIYCTVPVNAPALSPIKTGHYTLAELTAGPVVARPAPALTAKSYTIVSQIARLTPAHYNTLSSGAITDCHRLVSLTTVLDVEDHWPIG